MFKCRLEQKLFHLLGHYVIPSRYTTVMKYLLR